MKQRVTMLFASLSLAVGTALAQSHVTGKVVSQEDGEPVIGASVKVAGSNVGTVTDVNGNFTLSVPAGEKTIKVSYIGMDEQTVQVKGTNITVTLIPSAHSLDEVVVTGYGVTRKAAFTGAATTVGKTTIDARNDANPIKSLEGNVPGLQLSTTSGQPGAPQTIFIRGRNSINSGTQPLYVIDGIPFNADPVGARMDEGVTLSPLANLNANDIESITVLKDATATSIYGSRAANGVIVITTKHGGQGKTKVNFTAKVGWESLPSYTDNYKLCNADQNLELATEALLNAYNYYGENSTMGYYNTTEGLGLTYDKAGAESFIDWYVGSNWVENYRKTGKSTDWIKEITRKGLVQEYGIDINSGAKDKSAPVFYLSYNYLSDQSYMIGKDLKRHTLRFNLDQQPAKWVKYGLNTSFNYSITNNGTSGGYFSDPLTQVYMQSPLTPVYDENGNWNMDNATGGYNPVALRSENGDKNTAKQYQATVSPYVQFNILPELTWMTKGGLDLYYVDEYSFMSFLDPEGASSSGYGANYHNMRTLLTITNTLNYIKTFGGMHHLNALIGQEGQKTTISRADLENSNFPSEVLGELGLASIPATASTYKYKLLLASFFSNVQYDYDNKYYLSASYRTDGSSRFGKDNRWASFWSVGAKYRLSAEKFMEPTNKWLTDLTIRASYGTTGNQDVGDHSDADYLSWIVARDVFGYGYNYNGKPGSAHQQFGNSDLKWEKTGKFNVGIDATLFGRVFLTVDYYSHKTTDMVFAVPVSYLTGLSEYYKNIGSLSNKGIELSLGVNILQNKDWYWNVTFTGSHNKNKVIALSTDDPIESTVSITEAGRPLYQWKMREYAGVDPQTGVALWYKNETGDETTTSYNEAAKRYLGDANPSFFGSLQSTLKWKGIDFSFQFNYSLGGKIYGNNLRYDEQTGDSFYQNYTLYVYNNRWQKPGDVTDVPRMDSDDSYARGASSRYLMDRSYLKLRSVSLGYTLPKAWLKGKFIDNARVFVNAENLHTWTAKNYRGFDPSGVGANGVQWWNYPLASSVVFGLTLGF